MHQMKRIVLRAASCERRGTTALVHMALKLTPLKRHVSRLRGFVSFSLVAAAQFLSPAAAADPASKIDPPAWSHRHSREEIQAYGARAAAQEPEKKSSRSMKETRLRRMMERNAGLG